MDFKVELQDFFSLIEGEEISSYYASVIDEKNRRWKYAYHRSPRQSIDQFVREVSEAFLYHREDDFRMEKKEEDDERH